MNLSDKDTGELAKLANRSMKLQVNIQDGEVMVSGDEGMVYVTLVEWKSAGQ
jgi:uncharacterized protein YaeQ